MRSLPKTTAEQRAPFYDDVEDLISIGFLSHTVNMAGTRMSFRSLSSGDLFLLRANGDSYNWQIWMIASSIWMIDGYNLLGDANSAFHIRKKIQSLPQSALTMLFSVVKGLFTRQDKAVQSVEAYCYEHTSRFKWNAAKGSPIGNGAGIYGTERFMMNPVIQMWRFFNEIEDKRNFDEAQWDGFKLAASASAPKGVQKIDKHDRSHRENEENRRQDVLDRFYYLQKGIISPETKASDIESIALRAKSVDDLTAEMEQWVSGKEDFHDKVVNDYKLRITNQYDQERKEREARRLMLKQKYEEMELDTKPQPLVGYTMDQLEHVLKGRRPGVAQIHQDTQGLQEKMYHRHLKLAEKGLLEAKDGQLKAPKVDSELMSLISDRQVPFDVKD